MDAWRAEGKKEVGDKEWREKIKEMGRNVMINEDIGGKKLWRRKEDQ